MKRFLWELGLKKGKYIVYSDNQSVIDLNKNVTYHARMKHIYVRYNWIKEVIDKNLMKLEKTHTEKNPSNIMAMVVSKGDLCSELVGLNCH